MRRLFVVVALLCIMLVMRNFQAKVDAPDNVITLAAIGFVLLAAFAAADMGTRLSLPRVTGFILAGLALGPSAANILSTEVVTEMRMFNTLALGLIATSAGLELDLKSLLPLFKTLGATTAVKLLLGVPLVGLTLFAATHLLDLGVASTEERAALAIVTGVLSIGTSPSIALAILTETKAKGRLSDLVLGAAVFKDLVVVICLAIGVAVGGVLLNPTANIDSSVLIHVASELGGSLMAGAALGAVLIAYIRFIQAEMLLFVAAMILVVAELCRVFHLELLLVFIAAGFVVRNFSEHEHDLMRPLELVSLPVFVVFFTIAGASIQVQNTWSILPAAFAVCLVRGGVYWLAASFGGAVGRETPAVRANAWAAYLPQAGVTLGLVGVAANKLPILASQITTTGMAIVALNLLVGPVALRLALARVGEIPDSLASPSKSRRQPLDTKAAAPQDLRGRVKKLPPELERCVTELQTSTLDRLQALLTSSMGPALEAVDPDEEPSLERRLSVVRAYRALAKNWYEAWLDELAQLPINVVADVSANELLPAKGDGWALRFRLWTRRVRWRLNAGSRARSVPVRLCARMTLEASVAKVASQFYESALERHFTSPSARPATIPDAWARELDEGLQNLRRLLAQANTPRMARTALRFSEVEQTIRQALAPLDEARDEFYAARASAIWGSDLARRQLEVLSAEVNAAFVEHLERPAQLLLSKLSPAFATLAAKLAAPPAPRDPRTDPIGELAAWREDVNETRRRGFDEFTRALRASVTVRELGAAFRSGVERLPTELRCFQVPANGDRRHGMIRRLNVREIAEVHLIKRLVPTLDLSARALSNTFAHVSRKVRDILEPALAQLEHEANQASPGPYRPNRSGATIERLAELERRLTRELGDELTHQRLMLRSTLSALERDLATVQLTSETPSHRLRQWLSQVNRRVQPWLDRYSREAAREGADARTTRLALRQLRDPSLPESVVSWLSQQPVRDERIYSLQPGILERILEEEATWRDGQRAAVLVRGEIGSGKTSLLNICELELRSPRIIRLDGEGPEQARSLRETLGNVLGTPSTLTAVAFALNLQRPVILVDNLPVWLMRAEDPFAELQDLLRLITQTANGFWIVTADPLLIERFSPVVQVQTAFTTVVAIPQTTRKDLELMISARVARANQQLAFKHTPLGRALRRFGLPGDGIIYYWMLGRAARGNPGRGLSLCLESAVATERSVMLDVQRIAPSVRRLRQALSSSQLVALSVLLQVGPMSPAAVASHVGRNLEMVELDLAFLHDAGLLRAENQTYEVARDLRWVVIEELERLGAFGATSRTVAEEKLRRHLGRTLATTTVVAICIYFVVRSTTNLAWPHWALILGTMSLFLLPVIQNASAGVVMRALRSVRLGDTLSFNGTSASVRGLGLTHVRLTTPQGSVVLLPNRTIFSQRLTIQRSAGAGTLIRARVDVPMAQRRALVQWAYLCPYRVPYSPVIVDMTPSGSTVELHTWHDHAADVVEDFLKLKVGSQPHDRAAGNAMSK